MIKKTNSKKHITCQFNISKFWDYLNNLRYSLTVKKIIRHYGGDYRCGNYKSQNLDIKKNNLGYGLIHYSIIRNIRPQKVLCVGSTYGFIPFFCALACKHNQKGKVDFIDAGYDVNNPKDKGRHSFGQGFWKKADAKKHFSFLKVNPHINTFVMTSRKFAKKYAKRKYDYIYVDGDHTYEGVKMDYELFWPRLNKNGFMVFHDTDNDGYHEEILYGVNKFCKEYILNKKNSIHFPNPFSGLVISQKII